MSIDPQLNKSFRRLKRTTEGMKHGMGVIQEGGADQEKSPELAVRSPRLGTSAPTFSRQRSQRGSCLCSPTTHAGSFRCRLHRGSLRPSGASIGSRLSEFAGKGTLHGDHRGDPGDIKLS